MRYAIISDIHGNREALDAVTDALRHDDVGAYVSLGDIVGYGADPAAAVRALRALEPAVSIAGNHEWGVLGRLDSGFFNEYARASIEWTRGALGASGLEYARGLALTGVIGDMTFVHGSLEDPASFNYILNSGDACITIERMGTRLAFVGHSHVAGIFVARRGKAARAGTAKVAVRAGMRCLVNAGSVGQPRDGDPRAAYVIYDSREATVEIRRVPYDIEKARKKIYDAGLPAYLGDRLREGV